MVRETTTAAWRHACVSTYTSNEECARPFNSLEPSLCARARKLYDERTVLDALSVRCIVVTFVGQLLNARAVPRKLHTRGCPQ